MDMGSAILIIGSAALVAAFLLLVIGLVYSELMNSDIPRGVANSGKLHMVHGLYVSIAIVMAVLSLSSSTDKSFDQRHFVDEVCQHLAKESDTTEVSVWYRLASEHGCPAHMDVTCHFLPVAEADTSVDSHRVAVGGDSPGANLAATLCQRLARSEERHLLFPCAQVLIHPALQKADFNLPSYQQNHAVPILFCGRMALCFLQNLNGHISVSQDVLESYHVPTEPRPRFKKRLSPSNLPPGCHARGYCCHSKKTPSYILTCEDDVQRDDGILYRKQLLHLEKEVTW
ncbi:LOW QUALITY PROTEIN: arylacetamide deacetylase-like 4 [Tautogolabrus adspersus]